MARSERRAPPLPWAEVTMAAVVVAVVLLMVSPVATAVLDVLFAASIGLAVVLLMASLYVRTPMRLAAFPALVLVSTLVRLGLIVAVTRAILSDGDGGDVVAAFGQHVAGGNLVVGLVVFVVIAIFQFVVVARGAERVAEVAARFALDGLPGKQMAIDADVRAGLIDATEASRRRVALEREAQFYGAMDGAMKFVKGDAIAALLVVVIDLLAGLAIGVGWRGLSVADAASTYALLAVGAGLVVQLPALLVALAAGLLVTRVASEHEGGLGGDVGAQLLGQPRALAAAAVALAALALLPGLPPVPFLALAVLAGIAAGWIRLRGERPVAGQPVERPPASVELGASLREVADAVSERLDAVRQAMFDDLGVRVPPIAVRSADSLGAREVAVALDGVVLDYAEVPRPDAALVVTAVDRALRRLADELVTIDATQARLDELTGSHPAAVREVVPRLVTLPVLVEVLRGLVREGVSIRDLAAVLGGIARHPDTKDPTVLAEQVRATLRRHITAAHAPRGELAAWTVDAMIEDAVRGAVITRDGAAVLALEPELAREIVAAARTAMPSGGVVLTSGDVRRHLRALLAPELPEVSVLAPHELAAGVTVRAAGRIQV